MDLSKHILRTDNTVSAVLTAVLESEKLDNPEELQSVLHDSFLPKTTDNEKEVLSVLVNKLANMSNMSDKSAKTTYIALLEILAYGKWYSLRDFYVEALMSVQSRTSEESLHYDDVDRS